MRLNLDAAELDAEPEALTALADLLNIACGAHAGSASLATRALRRAKTRGVAVGAHPSYPDREGFGRRAMDLSHDALRESLAAQLRWLRDLAAAEGLMLTHVKPHGALYHAATRDPEVAACVLDATLAVLGAVTLIGMPDGALQALADARGDPLRAECFAIGATPTRARWCRGVRREM